MFWHPDGGGNHHRRLPSSSRRSPWWGGSSPPSGLRVCTSSYVFNLFLSRVLEMSRSWCIAGFVNIVESYGVFPFLSCCELSFSFEISFLSDWILLSIWEHLMYVLHMDTHGDNGVSYWFTWCMFWHSTHRFPRWHWGNLCVGVDARFRLDSLVDTSGHSLKFFVLVE